MNWTRFHLGDCDVGHSVPSLHWQVTGDTGVKLDVAVQQQVNNLLGVLFKLFWKTNTFNSFEFKSTTYKLTV